MLCQECKKNPATFHYTQNNNGVITEAHLCHKCAKKSGYIDDSNNIFNHFDSADNILSQSGNMLSELLYGMFAPESAAKSIREASVCPLCGMRLSDFVHSGKAGCAKCYSTFKNSLAPSLKKLHGNSAHIGKVPPGHAESKVRENKIEEYKQLLKKAIENQEYEKAAEYRDTIKELENNERSGK